MTRLEELPARMDRLESQIVQLRTEMHDEFSAVRDEFAAVRQEMGELATRREMREEFAAVRQEIRTGDQETRHYMRMLFEEYVGRIKTIDEGKDRRTTRPKASEFALRCMPPAQAGRSAAATSDACG